MISHFPRKSSKKKTKWCYYEQFVIVDYGMKMFFKNIVFSWNNKLLFSIFSNKSLNIMNEYVKSLKGYW